MLEREKVVINDIGDVDSIVFFPILSQVRMYYLK